jgi:hypothetical protein
MELLLIGIGGCSGMDIISILKKKKQEVTGLEINVNGVQAADYPKKFNDITIEFVVKGRNISEEAVKRAIDLSMNKYCSVKATLEALQHYLLYRITEDSHSRLLRLWIPSQNIRYARDYRIYSFAQTFGTLCAFALFIF